VYLWLKSRQFINGVYKDGFSAKSHPFCIFRGTLLLLKEASISTVDDGRQKPLTILMTVTLLITLITLITLMIPGSDISSADS
jgi:hypothetical protein